MKNYLKTSLQTGALAISTLATGCGTTKQVVKQPTQLVQDHYNQALSACTQEARNSCQDVRENDLDYSNDSLDQQTEVCNPNNVVDACAKFSRSYIAVRQEQELKAHGVCIDTIDRLGRGLINGLYVDNGRKPSKSALCTSLQTVKDSVVLTPSNQENQQNTTNVVDTQEVSTKESLSYKLLELSYKHTLDYITKHKSEYPYLYALSIHFKKFKSTTFTHVIKKMPINDLTPENVIAGLQKIFSVHLIPENYTNFPPQFLETIATYNSYVQIRKLGVHYKYVVECYTKLINSLREQGLEDIVEVKPFDAFYNNKSKLPPVW